MARKTSDATVRKMEARAQKAVKNAELNKCRKQIAITHDPVKKAKLKAKRAQLLNEIGKLKG